MKLPLALRLRLKLLWLQHSWSFNWAHKPLCGRFRENVLRVGRLHLCRSCTCLYAGIVAATAAFALLAPAVGVPGLLALGGLMALVVGLSLPRVYKRLPRVVRDFLRFGVGALLVAATYVGMVSSAVAGLAGIAVLYAFWRLYRSRRAKRKLHECDGCPELKAEGVCSGFAVQAEDSRAFERDAAALVCGSGSGCLPEFARAGEHRKR
jgi:hypothetical protein